MNNTYRRPGFFGGFSLFPPIIKLLLLSNVVIYIIFNLILANYRIDNVSMEEYVIKYFSLMPLGSGFFYPWQLVTYMFLHGGFFHLLLNMFALWMFGAELENLWGQNRFLFYYMLCGIGAGLCNLFIAPLFSTVGPTVGASGAIYGILVAYGYLFPDRLIYIYGVLPVKAKFLVLFYMIIEVFSVVGGTDSGIAHMAHIGGGVIGFIYLITFYRKSPSGFFNNSSSLKDRFSSYTASNKRTEIKPVYNEIIKNKNSAKEVTYKEIESTDFKKDIENQEKAAQEKIDAILDKLSEGGYQNLTPEEKKVLFQESKKLR